MLRSPWLPAILVSVCAAFAQPPVRIILVGDSTMAPKSGWGPGFCPDLSPAVICLNLAKGGRSTGSYRAEGSWAQVMETLRNRENFTATYVLIQFGHNDQPGKPGRSTDLATEFPANLRRYVGEVRAAGAKPALVTPLTRRQFREGRLQDGLGPWAAATRQIAADTETPLLDLHADSMAAVERMGPAEANTLAMAPPPDRGSAPAPPAATEKNGSAAPRFDYTHLGTKGAAFFAHIVEWELVQAIPELKPYVQPANSRP